MDAPHRCDASSNPFPLSVRVCLCRENSPFSLSPGARNSSARAPDEYLTAISARVIWQEMGFVTFAISVKDGHFLCCATRRRAISISSRFNACVRRLGGLQARTVWESRGFARFHSANSDAQLVNLNLHLSLFFCIFNIPLNHCMRGISEWIACRCAKISSTLCDFVI